MLFHWIHLFVVVNFLLCEPYFIFFTVILQFNMLQETLMLFQKNVAIQTTCTSIPMSTFSETIFELMIPRMILFFFHKNEYKTTRDSVFRLTNV